MRSRRWRSAFGYSACPHCASGLPEAHRRQHVLQPPARAQVHVHVAGGDQRQPVLRRESCSRSSLARSPGRNAARRRSRPRRRNALLSQPPKRKSSCGTHSTSAPVPAQRFHIRSRTSEYAALLAAAPAGGDQRGDGAVRAPVGGEQHQLRPSRAMTSVPRISLQAALLRRRVRAHHAGERAFVGQRERLVAERARRARPAPPGAKRRAGS